MGKSVVESGEWMSTSAPASLVCHADACFERGDDRLSSIEEASVREGVDLDEYVLRRSSIEPTDDFVFADPDETCRPRLAMSGALYESMFVVETSATGDDIFERSMAK